VQILYVFISCLFFQASVRAAINDSTISNGSIQVRFNSVSNTLEIAETELGTVLYNGVVEFQNSTGHFTSSEQNSQLVVEANSLKNELDLKLGDKAGILIKCNAPNTVNIIAHSSPETKIQFRADSACSSTGINAIAQKQRVTDCNVIFTTNGTVELGTNTLFDTKTDLLISAQSQVGSFWKWNNG
jgi:hypothetical protein